MSWQPSPEQGHRETSTHAVLEAHRKPGPGKEWINVSGEDAIQTMASVLGRHQQLAGPPLPRIKRLRIQEQELLSDLSEWGNESEGEEEDEKVLTPANVKKAKLLLKPFECVRHAQASPSTEVRKLFPRMFHVGNKQAGQLMERVGLGCITNHHRVKVAITYKQGLRLAMKTSESSECPMCCYFSKITAPGERSSEAGLM